MSKAVRINGLSVPPGQRATVDLPVAKLYTHTELAMPVHVINGKGDGPVMFVCAAIHGDEINGVEIIRRLLRLPMLRRLKGALIAIPIVNVHGFLERSRYLPDRRDLNRSFPGSSRGSLAARVAHIFVKEIVQQCTHGIDIHTGALHRSNLPQIRACLDDAETKRLAEAFGAPVVINTNLQDGSLRQAVQHNFPMLVYEAGEALRFDELSIRAGLNGVINVMRALEMLPAGRKSASRTTPLLAGASSWIRAMESGILRALKPLGARVEKGERLGVITDPFGESEIEVLTPFDGVIIGRNNLPLVHEGEALFHLARFRDLDAYSERLEEFQETQFPGERLYPEEPIL